MVRVEQGIDLSGEAELVPENSRIDRPHPRDVREQPAGSDLTRPFLVLRDGERDAGAHAGHTAVLGSRLPLGEQGPAVVQPRTGPQEGSQ